MALLQKIARTCPSAAEVVKIINEDNRFSEESNSLFSLSRFEFIKKTKEIVDIIRFLF